MVAHAALGRGEGRLRHDQDADHVHDLLAGRAENVAPRLLGALLTSSVSGRTVTARIVEVEAYGADDDPASHAYRGRTARNASMFGPPGTGYVYRSYGLHWCLNVTVEPAGQPAAVLLRAAQVVDGHQEARIRRAAASGVIPADRDLARGPARLCQALDVTGADDGVDLLIPGRLHLRLPRQPVVDYRRGPRVGIYRAADRPWRFWLPDEPCVSAYRGSQVRRRERGHTT